MPRAAAALSLVVAAVARVGAMDFATLSLFGGSNCTGDVIKDVYFRVNHCHQIHDNLLGHLGMYFKWECSGGELHGFTSSSSTCTGISATPDYTFSSSSCSMNMKLTQCGVPMLTYHFTLYDQSTCSSVSKLGESYLAENSSGGTCAKDSVSSAAPFSTALFRDTNSLAVKIYVGLSCETEFNALSFPCDQCAPWQMPTKAAHAKLDCPKSATGTVTTTRTTRTATVTATLSTTTSANVSLAANATNTATTTTTVKTTIWLWPYAQIDGASGPPRVPGPALLMASLLLPGLVSAGLRRG